MGSGSASILLLARFNLLISEIPLKIALSGGSSEGPAPSGFLARPKMRWNVG